MDNTAALNETQVFKLYTVSIMASRHHMTCLQQFF